MKDTRKQILWVGVLLVLVCLGFMFVLHMLGQRQTPSSGEIHRSELTQAQPGRIHSSFADAPLHFSFGTTTFSSDIAQTPSERTLGLSYSEPLPKNHGLFFVFEHDGVHGFWMKDMKYPIDIVWLDSALSVVAIQAHAQPESFPATFAPQSLSRYVLEVPAGFAKEIGLTEGSRLQVAKAPEELSHLITQ